MILSFINIRKVPREMLKTSGFANVNECIMFDPYIKIPLYDHVWMSMLTRMGRGPEKGRLCYTRTQSTRRL